MGANDRLARFDHAGASFALEFICYQQKEEAALEQVDAEEEGHEAEVGIVFENVVDCLGSGNGVRCR